MLLNGYRPLTRLAIDIETSWSLERFCINDFRFDDGIAMKSIAMELI